MDKNENLKTLSPQIKASTQDHLKNRMKKPAFQASVMKKAEEAAESGNFEGRKLSR
jgi:hypothetical protein